MVETARSWAILRQVVVATEDLDGDADAVRRAFGLGQGIVDPTVEELRLRDALLPVSATRFLEFVSPHEDNTKVGAWLAKAGCRTGMVLSVQHPDVPAVLARARAQGVRISLEADVLGYPAAQLHPADLGLLLEVDGIPDPSAWYWDDLDPRPEPDAAIDEIVGVVVPVARPRDVLRLWCELLDLEPSADDTIDLGGAWVRFIDDAATTEWTVVLRASRPGVVAPQLPGVRFDVV